MGGGGGKEIPKTGQDTEKKRGREKMAFMEIQKRGS